MKPDIPNHAFDTRRLRILYVAYPLLPVSDESCGGAEQMLCLLESEMHRRGHRTTVACSPNSRVAGEAAVTTRGACAADEFERWNAEHVSNVCRLIRERAHAGNPFDLVHDESGSFWMRAGEINTPVLTTLHLPRSFYPAEAWEKIPQNVSFNCVSPTQAATFQGVAGSVGAIPNGIDLEQYEFQQTKSDYLLWLGRVCEEKGAHIALDIAQQANAMLVLAGKLYPFSYHQQYCEREIVPRMQRGNGKVVFVDSPTMRKKLELLQNAKALLIPSLADETSSLVAMEAMACGTPVIAPRRGALPEIIADGVTGVIADSTHDMFEALAKIGSIRPADCRQRAEQYFNGLRMCDEYEGVYKTIVTKAVKRAA